MQPAAHQELAGAAHCTRDDQGAGRRRHPRAPGESQQDARGHGPARPRTVADRRLEVGDLERQVGGLHGRRRRGAPHRGGPGGERNDDQRGGDGDHRERRAETDVLGQHASDRGAEHDPHRGARHRRAEARPAARLVEVGQPRHAARPHHAKGDAEHDPPCEHRGQGRHRLRGAGQAQERARAEADAPSADPVGGDARRHRDGQRGQAGQRQEQGRLGRRQGEVRRHPRKQGDDRRLGDARDEEKAVDEPQRDRCGQGADVKALEKHVHEIVRFRGSVTDDCYCEL